MDDFLLIQYKLCGSMLCVVRLLDCLSLVFHCHKQHPTSTLKLGVMVYRCLHDQAPRYLADHLIPASDAAPRHLRLRSANPNRLTVPRFRLSTYGCRAFYHAGLTVWNSLPHELRNSDSFDGFK